MKEGWYEDPSDRHDYRWFSQGKPTSLVKDGTATSRDPINITDPAAFESMELKQPPDNAPLLRSGPAKTTKVSARTGRVGSVWGWWALAGVFAVLVGGLGWAYYWWTASSGVPAGSASYLLAARASLVFVQWHQPTSSGAVTGTITFAYLAGNPPEESLEVQSEPFTGQLSLGPGSRLGWPSISLTVNGLFLDDFLLGTFQNGKLVLNVPNEGSFGGSTYVLVRSDAAAYNAALRMLTARRQRANKMAVTPR